MAKVTVEPVTEELRKKWSEARPTLRQMWDEGCSQTFARKNCSAC